MVLESNLIPDRAIFKRLAWLAAACGWDDDEGDDKKKPWLQRDEKFWADIVLLNLTSERAETLETEVRALLSGVGNAMSLGFAVDPKQVEMMQPKQRQQFQNAISYLPPEVVHSIFVAPIVDLPNPIDRQEVKTLSLGQVRERLESLIEEFSVPPTCELEKIGTRGTPRSPTGNLRGVESSVKKLRNHDVIITDDSPVAKALTKLLTAQSDSTLNPTPRSGSQASAAYFARVDQVARRAVMQLELLRRQFTAAAELQNVGSPTAYGLQEVELFVLRTLDHLNGKESFEAFAGPRSDTLKFGTDSCESQCCYKSAAAGDEPPAVVDSSTTRRRDVNANSLELESHFVTNDQIVDRSLTSSLIAPQYPAVIPGGRFTEIYYWDSFWVVKGLCAIGSLDPAAEIVGNFLGLIDRFGFVPNGTRTYYLDRSQPPVFAAAVQCLVEAYVSKGEISRAAAVAAQCLPRLLIEYCGFWMNPSTGHLVKLQLQQSSSISNGNDTMNMETTPTLGPSSKVVTSVTIPDFSLPANAICSDLGFGTEAGTLDPSKYPASLTRTAGASEESGGSSTKELEAENDSGISRSFDIRQSSDGYFLNRYWSWRNSPRLESFVSDASLAIFDALSESTGDSSNALLRNVRAAAESGWDFSSRWCPQYIEASSILPEEGKKVTTDSVGAENSGQSRRNQQVSFLRNIRTTDVVPVDLNALLFLSEALISQLANFLLFHFQSSRRSTGSSAGSREVVENILQGAQGIADSGSATGVVFDHLLSIDGGALTTKGQEALLELSKKFRGLACRRQRAMLSVMWDSTEQVWRDFYMPSRQRSAVISAASLFPLWVGLGPANSTTVHPSLLAHGWRQLPTATTVLTGQQWDWPYVWPPVVDVAVSHCLSPVVHTNDTIDILTIGCDRSLDTTTQSFNLGVSIGSRFIAAVVESFERDGVFWEKYPPAHLLSLKGDGGAIGGGEYSNQVGFGWTNSVFLSLIARLGSYILTPESLEFK